MMVADETRAEFWRNVLTPIPDTSPLKLEADRLPPRREKTTRVYVYHNPELIEVIPVPPGAVRRAAWQEGLATAHRVEGWREALDADETLENWRGAVALVVLMAFLAGLFLATQGAGDQVASRGALTWLSEIGR